MAARIGALVAAVAMVVIAVVVRDRIDEHGISTRLTCSTELADVCNRLGNGVKVTVEPAGTTFDRLAKLDPDADPGLDGWLVAGPWPEMVNADRRGRALPELFGTSGAPVAVSPLVAVVEAQRAAVLRTKCGDPVNWACVGGAASSTWKDLGGNETFGRVKAAIADPAVDAEGAAVLGAMSTAVFGVSSTAVFGSRDFNADDDKLRQLLRNLRGSQLRPGADAVTALLVSKGAELDVAFTTEAAAQSVLASAANRSAATVLYPAPVTTANVELGTPVGRDTKATAKVGDIIGGNSGDKAFADAGWKPAVSTSGPTNSGVLAALRRAWDEQR